MKHPTLKIKPASVVFNEAKHTYTHKESGQLYTGCTTIASLPSKDFLGPWYAKEMAEALKAAIIQGKEITPDFIDLCKKAAPGKADIAKEAGHQAHAFCEAYACALIAGTVCPNVMPESQEARNSINQFFMWRTHNPDISFIASEEVVCSDKYRMAGMVDFLAKKGDKVILGDFKTSKLISEDYPIQLAGYSIMLEEMGLVCDEWHIVRFPKDGSAYEVMVIDKKDEQAYFRETFIHLREAHRYRVYFDNRNKLPKQSKPKSKLNNVKSTVKSKVK